MIRFERLGVVLEHSTKTLKTTAKFNAGMALADGVVHMVFRYSEWRKEFDASRMSNYSRDETRYARLTPEGKLLYESKLPLIAPTLPEDVSGCQDARITPLDGWYYLSYCGWDKDIMPPGQDHARMGFARTRDFKTVEKLGVVDHYTWDKDHYLFPERIGGKIALVHRISPNIQIDYFDSIEDMVDQRFWSAYTPEDAERATVLRAQYPWECGKVGGSVPPIRTAAGWLMIYHGVEILENPAPDRPFIYRMGLALLDLENPSKVVARVSYPVFEPEAEYEVTGDVNNVVFPVGGYVHEGNLYISYGGADRVTAIARAPLADILGELARYPA